MMGTICLLLKSFVVFVLLIYLITPTIEATNAAGGFSIDLIHRDSPKSPFYKPNELEAPTNRLSNSFRRFIFSVNRFNNASLLNPNSLASSQVTPEANGEYLLKLSIGNPPVDIYGIADTGSDLMWTQCQPCEQCYKQINPIYNPKASSSYTEISCQSQECHLLDTVTCNNSSQNQSICNYSYGYGDDSLTKGVLAKETISFMDPEEGQQQQPVSLQNIVFGCGHNNSGTFTESEMGLIGLGGGAISLFSQIGSTYGSKKFSQCLVPFSQANPNITGKMSLGNYSDVTGVISTPLVNKQDKTYYFITLKGISVGDKFIAFSNSSSSSPEEEGNIFIDSGTPPTILPQNFYDRLEDEVKAAIQSMPIKDDPDLDSQLCYKGRTSLILTAHFEGGADLQLMPINTFIEAKDDVFCFALSPTKGDTGVFGSYAQMNFWVGIDVDRKLVSFKPTDCSKQ